MHARAFSAERCIKGIVGLVQPTYNSPAILITRWKLAQMQDVTYYLSPRLPGARMFETDAPLSRLFVCWRVRSRTSFNVDIQAGRTWIPRYPRSLHEPLPVRSSQTLGSEVYIYLSTRPAVN